MIRTAKYSPSAGGKPRTTYGDTGVDEGTSCDKGMDLRGDGDGFVFCTGGFADGVGLDGKAAKGIGVHIGSPGLALQIPLRMKPAANFC